MSKTVIALLMLSLPLVLLAAYIRARPEGIIPPTVINLPNLPSANASLYLYQISTKLQPARVRPPVGETIDGSNDYYVSPGETICFKQTPRKWTRVSCPTDDK